jgi:hypothetical protein
MTRLTDVAPAYCSSCFGQKTELRHVDFDAAWDGPVIDPGNGIKQVIDDLIICEHCLAEAASLLGYGQDELLRARVDRLEEDLVAARRQRAEAIKYSQQLEQTIALRPERMPVPPRKNPQPRGKRSA